MNDNTKNDLRELISALRGLRIKKVELIEEEVFDWKVKKEEFKNLNRKINELEKQKKILSAP